MAKKDEHGNILTSSEAIKSLYMKTYQERLGKKNIAPNLENLKDYKEILCQKRLELAKLTKSEEVTIKKLEIVLKSLKRNKARDPIGLANELFKEGVIGKNLKDSLVLYLNKIKVELVLPQLA